MKRRIILHIGAPKCGSTYLQRVMLKNQRHLRAEGINYPHKGVGHPGNGVDIDQLTTPWIIGAFQNAHTVVVSHETLFALPTMGIRLRNLCRNHDIELQIVAFFRRFSDVLFADYSQTLKQGFNDFCQAGQAFDGLDFLGFAKGRLAKVAPDLFLRDWQSHTPTTRLILARHTEIRQTLERLLDIKTLDWSLPKWRANPSLRMCDCVEITRTINKGDIDRAEGQYRDAFANAQLPDTGRTTARAQYVETLFAPRRMALARDFGVHL
ncbi:MAG: hypothetical protein ACPGRD_03775 [Planktomarina sp.]